MSIPAPEMSFARSNLPSLLQELTNLMRKIVEETEA